MIIETIRAKSLIRSSEQSPTHVHLNPYQGCYHDCSYCDGKSERYYMHEDFTQRIIAKINAPDLLEGYLSRKGYFPYNRETTSTLVDYLPSLKNGDSLSLPPKFLISMFGNICDVYQPAESKFEITRKLLHIAYDYGFPIRLLTKSDLVLRDIDILKRIHSDSFARVSFTITLADEETQKIFEPKASTTQERFEALKIVREEGISAGVYVTPVIPFIGDTEENLHSIFQQAKEADAEFIISGGLTLRPGRNKKTFFHTLQQHFKDMLPKYQKLYGNNHKGGQPNPDVASEYGLIDVIKTGYNLSKKYGITFYEPRYIPSGQKRKNLQISTVLSRIAFLKEKVLHEQNGIREIRLAADYIEKTERDFEYMGEEELAQLPFNSKVIEIIQEIVSSNSCSYLESLEEWDNLLYSK
jgi:DNA repair photolyase